MRLHILLLSAIVGVAVSERNCTKPGIILSSDPHKFLVCTERNGKLHATVNQCSKGLVFDLVHKRCIRPIITALLLQSLSDGNTTYAPTAAIFTNLTNEPAQKPQPLPCKNPGAMCDSCNTMSFCVGSPAVVKILTLACETGAVCVTKHGCVKESSGGLCRQGKFKCGDVGTFPDLYDCTKYHTCSTDESTGQLVDEEKQCAGGLYGNRWSPVNAQCGWTENVDACRGYPIPLCNYELEMGSVGGPIYYICIVDKASKTLSPTLFRCPMDLVFDPVNFSCVANP